jgi:hypothetical protein
MNTCKLSIKKWSSYGTRGMLLRSYSVFHIRDPWREGE